MEDKKKRGGAYHIVGINGNKTRTDIRLYDNYRANIIAKYKTVQAFVDVACLNMDLLPDMAPKDAKKVIFNTPAPDNTKKNKRTRKTNQQ